MSKYLKALRVLSLIAFIISSVIAAGSASEFNGTTYCLTSSQMEVILPVNASKINLTLQDAASNITLIDKTGKEVPINSSYSFWRGDHKYSIVFGKHVFGRLIYSMPHQGQQFILSLRDNSPVRVILPPGYSTGNHVLGIARPEPDGISANKSGMMLTWQNVSPYQIIEVGYYQERAPEALMRIFAILVVAAVILLIEYYVSIRKLRAIREDAERRA